MKFKILLQLYLSHAVEEKESIFLKEKNDKPLIDYSIRNLLRHFHPGDIAAFVPGHQLNQASFRSLIQGYGFPCYPVKPGEITRRLVDYIATSDIDYAVRVIANNPFIDGRIISDSLNRLQAKTYDYVTFSGAPRGLTPSEIVSREIIAALLDTPGFKQYLEISRDNFILSYFRKQVNVSTLNMPCDYAPYSHLDLSVKNEPDFSGLKEYLGIQPDLEALSNQNAGKITMAHIEPTNRCNLDCIMCPRMTRKRFGMLTLADFKTILNKMPHLRRVNLNGDGEPFLNPELPEMLELAKQRGIMTRTITNATVSLDSHRLEKILSHLDFFNISLDGASKQTFEKIRRKGDFDQTLENIRQIAGIIKKNHFKLDESWINFVIQAANYHEISDMVKLTARLGLPALNFKLMNTNYDRGTRDLTRSGRTVKNRMETNLFDDKETIDRSIREAVQSGNRYQVKVFFQQDINKDFSLINCGLSQKVFITFDGYITPCCLRTEPGIFNFGNILTDDYRQVFGSGKYLEFIRGLAGGRPPALCTRCPSLETL